MPDPFPWKSAMAEASGTVFFRLRIHPEHRVCDLSPTVQDLTGYSAEEIRRRPALLNPLVDPILLQPHAEGEAHAPGVLLRSDLSGLHRRGHTIWFRTTARRFQEPDGGEVVEGMAVDLTSLQLRHQSLVNDMEWLRGRLEALLAALDDPATAAVCREPVEGL